MQLMLRIAATVFNGPISYIYLRISYSFLLHDK